VERETLKA